MQNLLILPSSFRNFDRRKYRQKEVALWDEVKCRKELTKLHNLKKDLYKDEILSEILFVKELISYINIVQYNIRKRIKNFESMTPKMSNKQFEKTQKMSDEEMMEYINKTGLLQHFGQGLPNKRK